MKLTNDTLKQLIKKMLTEQLGLQAVDLYTKAIQSTQKSKKSSRRGSPPRCPTKDLIRRLLDPKVAESGTYGEKGLQLNLLFSGLTQQYPRCSKRRMRRLRRYARFLRYRQRRARQKARDFDAERRRVNQLCFGNHDVVFRIEGKVVAKLNDALRHPGFRSSPCHNAATRHAGMTYGHWADARRALYRKQSLDVVKSKLPAGVWEGAPAETPTPCLLYTSPSPRDS